MMKIRCLIVDDEPLARELLESYVQKTPFLALTGCVGSATEALEAIHQRNIDLLFLDIQMPGLTGIELSRTLINGPKVIFTTAFEEYALEGFKVDALDYLLKPFSYVEFLKAVNKAQQWFGLQGKKPESSQSNNYSYVKSEHKIKKIAHRDILYVEGLKDYVKIYIIGQEKPIMSLLSMKAMEENLPASQFMRVHRSYIINLEQVHTIERSRIVFGKVYIPVSDKYKNAFQEFLDKRFLE